VSIEWVDWGDAAAWAAFGVALVAAFFSGRSVAEAKKARIAGERSAAAAEDSAREAKRSADAGEVSAQAAVRSADAAEKAHQLAEQQYLDSLPPPVAWEIRQVRKSTYQLINIGAATATGVSIDPDSVRIGRQFPTNATVHGNGGYVEFLMFGSMQAQIPTEIEVTWDGPESPAVVPVQKF